MKTLRLDAPAKINLRLVVLAREAGGYHSLETLFCGVSLCDRLEIAESNSGIDLEVLGDIETGPPERNLVVRAARLFYEELGVEPAVKLRLEKKIPAAAGLGGGSSDAAATLRGLNQLHGKPFDKNALLRFAAALGSDVPFFLTASPFALAWGRGQRLLELHPLAFRPVLIAHPAVELSTPAVFGRFAELHDRSETLPAPLAIDFRSLADWPDIERLAINDLEVVAAERLPQLGRAKQCLIRSGAFIALLSGSGAAIFGIFDASGSIGRAADQLQQLGFATFAATTLLRWPEARSDS